MLQTDPYHHHHHHHPPVLLPRALQPQVSPGDGASEGNDCPVCGVHFSGKYHKYNLKRHLNIHRGVRPFNCTQCGHQFNRRYNLERHLERVHNQPPAAAHAALDHPHHPGPPPHHQSPAADVTDQTQDSNCANETLSQKVPASVLSPSL